MLCCIYVVSTSKLPGLDGWLLVCYIGERAGENSALLCWFVFGLSFGFFG